MRSRLLSLTLAGVCTSFAAAQTPVTIGPYVYDAGANVTQMGNDRFLYDGLGRVTYGTAHIAGNSNVQQFEYDGFGNLHKVLTAGAPTLQIGIDAGTNRLLDTPGAHDANVTYTWGGGYDEAGNQRQLDGGVYSYTYDPLSMMVGLEGANRREFYLYDADDERVATVDSTWHYTVRDLDGRVLRAFADGQWKQDYVYRGPDLLASIATDSVTHYHLDHLGSPVLLTNASAQKIGEHKSRPFGRDAPGSTHDNEVMKFTGHERDDDGSANALDYMHARYYGANVGRFLSVDPTWDSADLSRPQTWNRYAYARNNPLKYTDPDGRIAIADDIAIGMVIGVTILTEAYLQAPNTDDPSRTNAEVMASSIVDAGEWLRTGLVSLSEHVKGKRASTRAKHEKGQGRKAKDRGKEKGDKRRRPPRKRPPGHKGEWPPKTALAPVPDVAPQPTPPGQQPPAPPVPQPPPPPKEKDPDIVGVLHGRF
jgi:RHS repeat-associated protein